MCERDRVAGNESKKFYGQPLPMHTQTHYGWTRVKASGPRLTALVSCPLASDSLAVAQCSPPQRRPTPPTPQNQLAQAARAWQRPHNALPSVESARTPRRVRGSHKSCAPPLCPHTTPLFVSASGTCTHHIPALRFPSRACSSGAGVAAPQSLCPPACVERAVRVPRRVRGSVMTPWTPL